MVTTFYTFRLSSIQGLIIHFAPINLPAYLGSRTDYGRVWRTILMAEKLEVT